VNTEALTQLLARFRRQMLVARILRALLGGSILGGIVAVALVDDAARRWVVLAMIAVAALWTFLALRGLRAIRRAQAGSSLLAAGRIDEACQLLADALGGLTPLHGAEILACHQLARAARAAHRYKEGAAICRVLLAQPARTFRSIAAATRLILADCLLGLDDLQAAATVIDAVDQDQLSLADRLTLLPVELRYQLAVEHDAEVVQALPEKVRLAELLDGPEACLAHALLAEGCRRMNLTRQKDFLMRRASLLADLDQVLAGHHQILSGLGIDSTAQSPPQTGNT